MQSFSSSIRQLDSLRALAVLAVLVHHFYPGSSSWGLGYCGVKLFFVISGFLITGILLDSRRHIEHTGRGYAATFFHFYLRRTLRIVPVYYVVLSLGFFFANTDVISGVWWYATYVSNFLFIKIQYYPSTTAHLWSLAAEAQFYLLWPFVVLLIRRQYLFVPIGLLILVGPLFRFLAIYQSYGLIEFYTHTLSSLDSLGWGALLAWLHHCQNETKWLVRTGSISLIFFPVISALFTDGTYFYVLDNVVLSLAFVWLIAGTVQEFQGVVGRILNSGPLLYIGKISYGIYLYHLFVPWMLYEIAGQTLPAHETLNSLLFMSATIVLASLSWHILEKPIHDLKRYIPRSSLVPQTSHHSLAPG